MKLPMMSERDDSRCTRCLVFLAWRAKLREPMGVPRAAKYPWGASAEFCAWTFLYTTLQVPSMEITLSSTGEFSKLNPEGLLVS